MKKISLIIFTGILLTILLLITVAYSVRQEHWWYKHTLVPDTYGSEWHSEDGRLTFGTFEKYDDFEMVSSDGQKAMVAGGNITQGFLKVDGKEIPVYVTLGADGSFALLLNDKPYRPDQYFERIESWGATDYKETDSHITVVLKVMETTYFEKEQEIELICEKNERILLRTE